MGQLEISVTNDFEHNDLIVTLRIPKRDLASAQLDKFDRLLLRECESPDAKISDKVLGLETIVRRIEEYRRGMRNPLVYVQRDIDRLMDGIESELRDEEPDGD